MQSLTSIFPLSFFAELVDIIPFEFLQSKKHRTKAQQNNKFGIDGVAKNVKIYGYAYKGNIPDYNPVSIMDIKYWNAKMLAKGVKVINISSGNTKLLVAAQNGVARAKKSIKRSF